MKIEYGLSFVEGKRVVRYPSRERAEAEQPNYPSSVLVERLIGEWVPAAKRATRFRLENPDFKALGEALKEITKAEGGCPCAHS